MIIKHNRHLRFLFFDLLTSISSDPRMTRRSQKAEFRSTMRFSITELQCIYSRRIQWKEPTKLCIETQKTSRLYIFIIVRCWFVRLFMREKRDWTLWKINITLFMSGGLHLHQWSSPSSVHLEQDGPTANTDVSAQIKSDRLCSDR